MTGTESNVSTLGLCWWWWCTDQEHG